MSDSTDLKASLGENNDATASTHVLSSSFSGS